MNELIILGICLFVFIVTLGLMRFGDDIRETIRQCIKLNINKIKFKDEFKDDNDED